MTRILVLFGATLGWCLAAVAQVSTQFPPASDDGQCFARVLSPAVNETIQEEVLVTPESYRIEVIPAVYETSTKRILVKEETSRFTLIPAVTEIIEDQVMVEPERIEKVVIPARFETYTEQVLVEPERAVWKAGSGLYGRTAGSAEGIGADGIMTGELLCRVVEPAKYRTMTRTRLVEAPRIEEQVIPARFETVRREVVVEPARYVEEIIPAVYEERMVRVLVKDAQERQIVVPAIYATMAREVVVGGGELQWAEVLCESNTDRYKIAELQGALTDAGFPTLIDGAFGPRTQRAMEAFQRERGLAVGYMTVETARALNVDPYGAPPAAVYAMLDERSRTDRA